MKKLFISLLFILLIQTSIYSAVFDSYKSLNVLESDNFEIIFDDLSVKEGFLIYENCEQAYHDIITFFDIERTQKINVVITSDYQQLNAYFSFFPSPHIVLFNTVAINNNLNVFSSDYLLNVFKHELTHALTLMGENTPIRKIFSQNLSFSYLNITPFNSEGFAVVFESLDGEGRLNSASYKSRILEAKVENKFPKYYEVQGNRDIYPKDFYYLYGAFFNKYLIDEFGYEKFTSYVKELNKFQILFLDANFAFEKVYNQSIFKVWHSFEESFVKIDVKNIESKQLDFKPTFITKAENTIYVYERITDQIKDIKNNEVISRYNSSIYNMAFGDNTLVLSGYKNNPTPKTEVTIVDSEGKQYLNLENFKMAIPYQNYIIGILNEGESEYIAFVKDKKIDKKIKLNADEYIQKIGVLNDDLVFLSKFDKKDTLSIIKSDNSRTTYTPKDNLEIIDFSTWNNNIVLSTVADNQLARLSYIDTKTNKLFTNEFDIVGGVYSPIILNNNVYYISKLFDENQLKITLLSEFKFSERNLKVENREIYKSEKKHFDLDKIQKYNLGKYLLKGTFLPFPFYDGTGISTNIFYQSIDPAEYINLQLYLTTELYGSLDTNLTLNLSNETNYKTSGLNITLDGSISQMPTIDLSTSHIRVYDLNNNFNSIAGLTINSNLKNALSVSPQVGLSFNTNVGPTSYNTFSILLKYYNEETLSFAPFDITSNNYIEGTLKIPYLLFFIKNDKSTFNLPIKLITLFDFNTRDFIYDIRVLIFNINIQSSFIKIPIFLHNIQLYADFLDIGNKKEISASLIFPSSLTQSSIFSSKLYPGIKYSYDLTNQKPTFEVNLFSRF